MALKLPLHSYGDFGSPVIRQLRNKDSPVRQIREQTRAAGSGERSMQSGSLAIFAAIRRAPSEKHDLDQRRERACPSIGPGKRGKGH